jgi:hypothetical protein
MASKRETSEEVEMPCPHCGEVVLLPITIIQTGVELVIYPLKPKPPASDALTAPNIVSSPDGNGRKSKAAQKTLARRAVKKGARKSPRK